MQYHIRFCRRFRGRQAACRGRDLGRPGGHHRLCREGEARSATSLEEDVEAYLVFVLMRHLGDAGLLRRTMALDLLEALEASGRARLDELRDVGDRCLLIAGLFPCVAARRRVGAHYFADLGRGAYANVADAARVVYAALFARLAVAFDPRNLRDRCRHRCRQDADFHCACARLAQARPQRGGNEAR